MKGDIVKILNHDELLKRLRKETDERVKPRLIFLNAMANHDISYEKASEICGLSLSTGYVWIRKWNAGGFEALKDKETRTGRPPRLNKTETGKTSYNCPAKHAGLIDRVWSIEQLLTFPYHKIPTG